MILTGLNPGLTIVTNVVPCCCLDNNPLFISISCWLAAAIEDPLANLLGYVKCESRREGSCEGCGAHNKVSGRMDQIISKLFKHKGIYVS